MSCKCAVICKEKVSLDGPSHFGVGLKAAEVEEIAISAVVDFDSCLSLGESCRKHLSEEETEQRWGKHATLLHSI